MHSIGEKHKKVAPFKKNNYVCLSYYLEDENRPILRVSVVEKSVELTNSPPMEQHYSHGLDDIEEDLLNIDIPKMDPLNMDIPETEEEEYANFSGVEGNSQEVEATTQSNHNYEDGTKFYKVLSFKNKRELVVSLKLSSLKASFCFKLVKSTKFVYCVKYVDNNCKWWLRAIKYIRTDRIYITRYKNEHTCESQHLTEKYPHASVNVIGEYIHYKFEEGRGPSNKEIMETVRLDLGCNVSYYKCMKGGHIAKAMYRYALRKANERSKTALKLDNCGKFQYFFVAYEAWIQGFLFMRKVIAIGGTFLMGKYRGVLLSAVTQDSENHIFPVAFCVLDKECDAAYEYFFEQLSSIHPDSVELCIISDRHISIANGISKFYPQAHHGFFIRHLVENIRKNFYCGDLLHHYYSAAKAYRIDKFNDHFQQINNNDVRVSKYLEEDVRFHKWSRAHFPGNMYINVNSLVKHI
ncbi:uncharacterized protein LOC142175188 [Nicotiana tabacum]|uniref:Uncharacterized protein LOC142175188 n=1 Tax=Nicotiana tabacum TaxID=4097 RepID=A0AC58TKX6_TOBAC